MVMLVLVPVLGLLLTLLVLVSTPVLVLALVIVLVVLHSTSISSRISNRSACKEMILVVIWANVRLSYMMLNQHLSNLVNPIVLNRAMGV
jgi:hypothetical protein